MSPNQSSQERCCPQYGHWKMCSEFMESLESSFMTSVAELFLLLCRLNTEDRSFDQILRTQNKDTIDLHVLPTTDEEPLRQQPKMPQPHFRLQPCFRVLPKATPPVLAYVGSPLLERPLPSRFVRRLSAIAAVLPELSHKRLFLQRRAQVLQLPHDLAL